MLCALGSSAFSDARAPGSPRVGASGAGCGNVRAVNPDTGRAVTGVILKREHVSCRMARRVVRHCITHRRMLPGWHGGRADTQPLTFFSRGARVVTVREAEWRCYKADLGI